MRNNVALLLITLIVSLGFVEFMSRKLFMDATVMFPRYHTDAQYGEFTIRRIRPNSNFTHTSVDGSWKFITNKQGFRNTVDFDFDKKNKLRVVSIGDSHTQGYESDQNATFSAVIERKLKSAKIEAEVFNTGVSGFSTSEELVLLEHQLVKFKPDFVVLGFFANDYQDNLKAGIYGLDKNGNLKILKKQHIPGVRIQNYIYAIPGVQWLSENSYFYSVLFNSVWAYFKQRLAKNSKKSTGKTTDTTEYAVATKGKLSKYQIRLTGALIERIYKVTKKMKAKLIIVDIPQARGESGIKPSVVDAILPLMKQNSDLFVSNQVLKKYNQPARFHVPHGHRHISEITHRLLGNEVADFIISQTKNPQ